MHLLLRDGVNETYLRGVEHEPFCGLTIQPISYNRRIQSFGMSGVNTQLVRPTGERKEIHEHRATRSAFAYHIARDSRFAVLPIYHLPRPVIRIGQ